jgi:hypothetical protein
MLIHYVDALAGAGKTHGAIKHAIERARRGDKVAIVQPSKHLIQQSYNQAIQTAPDVMITRVDSSTNPRGVRATLITHLNRPFPEGEILFVTHAAFFGLPYWHNRAAWHVIIDEIPGIIEDLSLQVPVTHRAITQYLELHGRNHIYSRVRAREGTTPKLQAIADNDMDDAVYGIFAPTASRILNPNWLVFAHTANFERISGGAATAEENSLKLFGLMLPTALEGFASVAVMGAMFHESVLAMVWRAQGAVFKPHPVIQNQLRYQCHTNGALLTIEYLWDHHWSKRFRDSTLADRRTVFEASLQHACKAMAGREFIYVTNLDGEDAAGHALHGGIQVSSVCHGLNSYNHINSCVFLSALKFTGNRYKCLETISHC